MCCIFCVDYTNQVSLTLLSFSIFLLLFGVWCYLRAQEEGEEKDPVDEEEDDESRSLKSPHYVVTSSVQDYVKVEKLRMVFFT